MVFIIWAASCCSVVLTFTIPGCGMQFQYPLASPPRFFSPPLPGGAGGLSEGIAYLVLNDLPRDALATFIVLWRTVVFYVPILLGGGIFFRFSPFAGQHAVRLIAMSV